MNNRTNLQSAFVLLGLVLLLLPLPLAAANPQDTADNTMTNKENSAATAPTADQAHNNLTDRNLMKHIRQDVVKDKTLSTYAHNVKIIAQSGRVTLRGPVRSEQEKQTIKDYALKYVGNDNILDEITVKERTK